MVMVVVYLNAYLGNYGAKYQIHDESKFNIITWHYFEEHSDGIQLMC